MSFKITPEERSATIAKIEKINARAAKRGFTGRLEVTSERVEETHNEDGFPVTEVFYLVSVTGEAPSYNGWTFQATLDWDPNAGLIVRTAPGVDHINREGLREGYCDHCKTDRRRRNTYAVVNETTGEMMQVGSTCIKDFLGWTGHVVFIDPAETERELSAGMYVDPSYSVETVLAIAWATIQDGGFVPASGYGTPTKSRVMQVLRPFSKADRDYAASIAPLAALAGPKATEIREFILSDDFAGTSDYVYNLKAITAAEFVSARQIGFLASAPQALAKHQERTLVRKAQENADAGSEWVGSVKDKIEVTGTVETITHIDGGYGTSLLYRIRDDAGNVYKWFSSAWALGEEVGRTVTLKGTVKEHDEWKGIKTTVLTRCKEIVAAQ